MTNIFVHSMYFRVCFPSHSSTWRGSDGSFPALIIASEHAILLPFGDDLLPAITCYFESSISTNVLTKIQDSFGDKIPMIAAAMQPDEAFSRYEIEVADPLTDVVMSNLLRMSGLFVLDQPPNIFANSSYPTTAQKNCKNAAMGYKCFGTFKVMSCEGAWAQVRTHPLSSVVYQMNHMFAQTCNNTKSQVYQELIYLSRHEAHYEL